MNGELDTVIGNVIAARARQLADQPIGHLAPVIDDLIIPADLEQPAGNDIVQVAFAVHVRWMWGIPRAGETLLPGRIVRFILRDGSGRVTPTRPTKVMTTHGSTRGEPETLRSRGRVRLVGTAESIAPGPANL